MSFYEDETGKYVIGADSVPKKLGKSTPIKLYSGVGNGTYDCSSVKDYAQLSKDKMLGSKEFVKTL